MAAAGFTTKLFDVTAFSPLLVNLEGDRLREIGCQVAELSRRHRSE